MMGEALQRLMTLCAGAAILSYVITGIVAHGQFLKDPVSERSNHNVPTSRAGGFVILLLTVVLLMVARAAGAPNPPDVTVVALLAGVLGAIDDIKPLPAFLKLLVLAALSFAMVMVTGPVSTLPIPLMGMHFIPDIFAWPLSVFFVLAFVNAFNFMDGLNGMAGSVGIVGIGTIVALGAADSVGLVIVALILAAVLYGFTVRNLMKGNIFLGDAGSLSIGMFIAGSALWSERIYIGGFYIVAIAFLPYILDTGWTLVTRTREGKSLLDAHKEHIYQRLRERGWSHQAVAASYAGMTLVTGIMSYIFERNLGALGLWLAGGVGTMLFISVTTIMFRKRQDSRITELSVKSSSTRLMGDVGKTDSAEAARSA